MHAKRLMTWGLAVATAIALVIVLRDPVPGHQDIFWAGVGTLILVAMILLVIRVSVNMRKLSHALDVAEGFCVVCRYDLRATPERCPECGTVVEVKDTD